jgi:phage baseplate assembly protein gpV
VTRSTTTERLLGDELPDLKSKGVAQINGVVSGTVVDIEDPLCVGRVRVQVDVVDSLHPLPWARVAVAMAGPFAGSYAVPNLGDEVLVAFENGDVDSPYVIGCLWNGVQRPPLPSPLAQIRVLRTPVGNQLAFTDVPPTVTLQCGPTQPAVIPQPATPTTPPSTVRLAAEGVDITSPTRITLSVGSSSITLLPQGVVIVAPEVSMIGGAQVVIQANLVRINC